MLARRCCDSEGNITGLGATACNCLSVPYGSPACRSGTSGFSNSNPANLIRLRFQNVVGFNPSGRILHNTGFQVPRDTIPILSERSVEL